jgi:deoxycytidylate deaminase
LSLKKLEKTSFFWIFIYNNFIKIINIKNMLKDENFINIAYEIATGSKCISIGVWAIIVKDNRILSTGYNWTPSWYINCCDYMKNKPRE